MTAVQLKTPSQTARVQAVPRASQSHPQLVRRRAPATCGELMQGFLDGEDFLVNCPIDRYSEASIRELPWCDLLFHQADEYGKVVMAIARLEQLALRNAHTDATELWTGQALVMHSDVPRGKGMASSSADIAAALDAICVARNLAPDPIELTHLMVSVEPSDAVHLPGIGHVNHLNGTVYEILPAPTALCVMIVDCGGEIDTVKFEREHAREVYRAQPERVRQTLQQLKHGLRRNDLAAIAEAATTSAAMSQEILYKPCFEHLLERSLAAGALGVNCAHSGTVLGVLFRADAVTETRLLDMLNTEFADSLNLIGVHAVQAGGCHGY